MWKWNVRGKNYNKIYYYNNKYKKWSTLITMLVKIKPNIPENQPDIDKIYLYTKDPYESKYQYLINKRKGVGINHFNDPKAFIDYSNDMHDVYKNIDEYNPYKKNKILIVFDKMIADMFHNKKLNSIVIKLFIRGVKLNISLFFITQSYFKVPKDVRY